MRDILVALHGGVGLQDGSSDEVAVRVSGNRHTSSVEGDVTSLGLARRDQSLDALLGRGIDEGTTARVRQYTGEKGERGTYISVLGSNPFPTLSPLARAMSSGIQSCDSPTVTTAYHWVSLVLRSGNWIRRTDGESHAALSSSSERSTDDGVERKVLVGVRHQDTVVCSHFISCSSSRQLFVRNSLLAPKLACTRFPSAPAVS